MVVIYILTNFDRFEQKLQPCKIQKRIKRVVSAAGISLVRVVDGIGVGRSVARVSETRRLSSIIGQASFSSRHVKSSRGDNRGRG